VNVKMSNANNDKLETIRAKKAKFLSQVQANPTKSTLDAVEHEQNLEEQRQKRAESTVEIENPANTSRKACEDNGNLSTEEIPSDIKGDDYPFTEAKAQFEKKDGKASPTPVIE